MSILKRRGILIILAILMFISMIVSFNAIFAGQRVESWSSNIFHITMSTENSSGIVINIESLEPLKMYAKMDGKVEQWTVSGSKEVQIPYPSKTPSVFSLYWNADNGSYASSTYSKVCTLNLEKKNGEWFFEDSFTVMEKNHEQLGVWGDPFGTPSDLVRQTAESIVGSEKDPYKQALLIHNWVCENIYYIQDGKLDVVGEISSDEVIKSKTAHCGGYQQVFKDLCNAVGIPCINVYGTTGTARELDQLAKKTAPFKTKLFWTHGWNEFYADGWHIVDCTWDSCSKIVDGQKKSSSASMFYFDADVSFFSLSHLALGRDASPVPAWAQESYLKNYSWNPFAERDPNTNMSRQEFSEMAVRFLEYNGVYLDSAPVDTFADTKNENVLKAYAAGIVNGYDGKFSPYAQISRQEMAVILSRLFALIPDDGILAEKVTYSDHNQIADWAKDAVYQMQQMGIMNGVSNNRFAPKDPITFAQATVIFAN